jgi:hypothetical protein
MESLSSTVEDYESLLKELKDGVGERLGERIENTLLKVGLDGIFSSQH